MVSCSYLKELPGDRERYLDGIQQQVGTGVVFVKNLDHDDSDLGIVHVIPCLRPSDNWISGRCLQKNNSRPIGNESVGAIHLELQLLASSLAPIRKKYLPLCMLHDFLLPNASTKPCFSCNNVCKDFDPEFVSI